MRFHPVKYAFDERLDPASSPLYRLFLFWHSYVEEEKLLQDWHEFTAKVPQPTNNILFDSFLDSWGKGRWEEVRNDVPFEKRSYFQALGVVSNQLIKQLRANVLDDFLVPGGDTLRPDLSEVDRKDGDRRAQVEIEKILASFNRCVIPSLREFLIKRWKKKAIAITVGGTFISTRWSG